jgi:hypothetical protein
VGDGLDDRRVFEACIIISSYAKLGYLILEFRSVRVVCFPEALERPSK